MIIAFRAIDTGYRPHGEMFTPETLQAIVDNLVAAGKTTVVVNNQKVEARVVEAKLDDGGVYVTVDLPNDQIPESGKGISWGATNDATPTKDSGTK